MTNVPGPVLEAEQASKRHKAKHRKRGRAKVVALILAVLMVYPTASYVQALTYPGAATFGGGDFPTAEELLAAADRAMYVVKAAGGGGASIESRP